MNVLIRVDASIDMGSGHLMRCLTLADALRPFANVMFVCRYLLPSLEQLLLARGYVIQRLPVHYVGAADDGLKHSNWLGTSQSQDAQDTVAAIAAIGKCDWLVIDHYGLDERFETPLREHVGKILVIDDLADRRHDCDVLIDQNPYADMETRYADKVPEHCLCLLGTRYCFLRDEFLMQREITMPRSGSVRSILIYFGGVDRRNRTLEAVEAVLHVATPKLASGQLVVNVVVGSEHPAIDFLHNLCLKKGVSLHIQTQQMAVLMGQADLAVGAGGISTFERLYLRLPALLTPVADNQIAPLRFMESLGYFQLYDEREALEGLLRDVLAVGRTSPPDSVENGLPALVHVMKQEMTMLKSPTALDLRRTFNWLQSDELRAGFQMTSRPTRSKHFIYWRRLLKDYSQRAYAIYYRNSHVGNCGFKNIDADAAVCEMWIYRGDASVGGQGVATAAVKALKRIARQELQCKHIYIHVVKLNLAAVRLYKNSGFVEALDELKPPWEHRGADMQKMVCVL